MGLSCRTCLPRFRCLMNSAMPPLYLNSADFASPVLASVVRSSVSVISRPLFRNASSRRRCASVSKLYSVAVKMLLIGQEVNFGAALLAGAGFLQLAGGLALGIGLLPGKSVAPDFQIELFAERVHAGNADAVQSAGNFVGRRVEFSAGMQLGHHHLRGGNFFAVDVHRVHGNAAAVVDDRDGVVEVNRDFDLVGVTGESFVHRIVDDFIDQMVQSHLAGGTDVHGGTLAHRLHAAQHFDGVSVVVAVASIDGSELPVFWLSFVDGSDFFRSHSAPWKGPDVGLSRHPFPMSWNLPQITEINNTYGFRGCL